MKTKNQDNKNVPNTDFTIGQRVRCEPLGGDGHIVGYDHDGFILIIEFVNGGTVQVPPDDCVAR